MPLASYFIDLAGSQKTVEINPNAIKNRPFPPNSSPKRLTHLIFQMVYEACCTEKPSLVSGDMLLRPKNHTKVMEYRYV
ncbi:MAG: hypothetical protein ACJAWI_000463 [Marinomonas primoryensis]|jgi:hypothetical protein